MYSESELEQLSSLDDLDDGIKEWVLFLRQHNFRTVGSCQGSGVSGTTHGKIPMINMLADKDSNEEQTVLRLKSLVGEDCYIHVNLGSKNFPHKLIYMNPPYEIKIKSPNNVC